MASGTESKVEEVEATVEHVLESSVVASTTSEGTPTSRESAVWIYFEKVKKSDQAGTEYHVANCGKTIKISQGNTTNLMSHLRTKHSKIYKEVRQKTDERKRLAEKHNSTKQQSTLLGMAARKAKLDSSSILHKKITKGIAGMMIHDFQPYSFVEDRWFIELMQQLERCYQIPHRTTFSRSVVPSIYKEVKEQVESILSDVQQSTTKLALTTDM